VKTILDSSGERSMFKRVLADTRLYRPREFRPFLYLNIALSVGMLILAIVVTYYALPDPGIVRMSAIMLTAASTIHLFTSEHDWLLVWKRRRARTQRMSQKETTPTVDNDVEVIFDGLDSLDIETIAAVDSMLEMDIAKSFRKLGMLPPFESEADIMDQCEGVSTGAVANSVKIDHKSRVSCAENNRLRLVKSTNLKRPKNEEYA